MGQTIMSRRQILLPTLFLTTLLAAATARAGGTVQLELVGDARGSAMIFQEWAQTLGKAGIRNVRIRVAEASEKPGIDVQGTAENPVYVVLGIVESRDAIVLPNGRYRRGDVARLAQWLKDLAEHGPNAGREKKGAFGLTPTLLARVRKDLATGVGFNTQGMTRRRVVEKIAAQLKLPLRLDDGAARAMADDKVEDELTDLACGTALACVLRPVGYCLVPRDAGGETAYAVVKAAAGIEGWPVGWEQSDKPTREALPGLYEFHNVNLQNVPAATAIGAIAKLVKAPVLVDHYALARHKIDLAKVTVSLPRSRTTYSLTLRKMLFQARLKFDVRYDEAGAPLLWITTLKPA
jgi:hypothetical protein